MIPGGNNFNDFPAEYGAPVICTIRHQKKILPPSCFHVWMEWMARVTCLHDSRETISTYACQFYAFKKYADLNSKHVAEIWYRIVWNQLPHLVPQGCWHSVGNHWLTDWMSLWHLTNRRWNYDACIDKWYSLYNKCLQCSDAVGWAAGRASGL